MIFETMSACSGCRSAFNSRIAIIAITVVGAFSAVPESAARGCLEDPAISGRTCSQAECLSLQAGVNSACKNPAPVSCRRISGCSALRQMKVRWLVCYSARVTINSRCWGGGDPEHQEEAAKAIQNVANCDARIALPEPIGCGDPCPQIPGNSLWTSLRVSEGAEVSPIEDSAVELIISVLGQLAEEGLLEAIFEEGNRGETGDIGVNHGDNGMADEGTGDVQDN